MPHATCSRSPAARRTLEQGIQIGDVRADRAVIWSRSDRAAQLLVEYDVSEHFANPIRVRGPSALKPVITLRVWT